MLTAIAGIILGMGLPTTPAYIVMVALLVPALIKLGAVTPAAHMFAFYFAILSAITPPVALAVFAAASLAKANMWDAGWAAMRVGAAGYIVPFMFVYEPALLMIGPWYVTAARARERSDRRDCACREPPRLSARRPFHVAAGGALHRRDPAHRARADQFVVRTANARGHRYQPGPAEPNQSHERPASRQNNPCSGQFVEVVLLKI